MGARVSSPVLVGRSAEMERLRAALRGVEADAAATVLVGGEAGIGKSRLIEEFGREAAAGDAQVLVGACVSLGDDDGLPFAPIAEALRALARRTEPETLRRLVGSSGSELGRLVPEFGRIVEELPATAGQVSPGAGRPEWAQTRIFEELLGLLGRLAEAQPVVLAIEDLHWADRSTRDVVAFIARNARTERVLVMGTYRSDELHRRHPLRPWLAEMDRAPRVTRFELARFDRAEVAAQLEAILGAPPRSDLVDAVLRRSDGNPFFAEEVVAAAERDGPRDGASARARSDGPALPETLRDVLLARLGSLSDAAQWALGVAAVGGRVVGHELLESVAGDQAGRLEDGLREAVAHQVLLPSAGETGDDYAFRHALLQEAVYDDLLPTDRRRLHAAYAAAFAALATPDGARGAVHLAALAHHASLAHDNARALSAWIDAARASQRTAAVPEAARAFDRALALWDVVPADDRPTGIDEIQLLHEAALARMVSGDVAGARDLSRRAVESLDPGTDPVRAAILRERLGRSHWLTGDSEAARRVLEEAVALVRDAPPRAEAAYVVAGFASMLMLKGEHTQAIEVAEEAIALARAANAPAAEGHALNTLGVSVAMTGDCGRGIALLREAIEVTKPLNVPEDLARCYANIASVLASCNQLEAAVTSSLESAAWTATVGLRRTYGPFHAANAASTLIELGRWDEARDLLDSISVAIEEGVTYFNWAYNTATLAVRQGRHDEAAPLITELSERLGLLRDAQFTGPTLRAAAELALAERRIDDAERIARDAVERLSELDDPPLLTIALATAVGVAAERAEVARPLGDVARLGAAAADGERYLEALRDVVAGLGESRVAHEPQAHLATAEAEARRWSGTSPTGAVDAWAAAVAAWDALRRPYPAALARYRQAEAILAAGGPRSEATGLLAAARAVAERLRAAPLSDAIDGLARRARLDLPTPEADGDQASASADTAAGPTAAADPFGLTDREREVLVLLAEGLTNRAIAGRLFISESTAGVHVSNILGKLGVARRAEAAAVAVRLGLDASRR